MKSRLKICIKFFINSNFKDMFNLGNNPLIPIALGLLLIFIINLPLTFLVNSLYPAYENLNQIGSLIGMILFMGSLTTFLMGIYTVFNNFFFSNDIDYLMPLPFKPGEIMTGKFISTLLMMYLYVGVIILPLLQVGEMAGYDKTYYLIVFLVILFLPILPLGYCILISLLLMRVTNVSKHKDKFKLLGGILGLVFVVVVNMFNSSSNHSESKMIDMLTQENGMMEIVNGVFITNKFAAEGLVSVGNSKGYSGILIYIAVSLAVIVAVYFLGQFFYKKAVIGMSETFSKKENILKNGKADLRKKSPIATLVSRDLKVIVRTPTFFLNCICMLIYFPAILLVTSFSDTVVQIKGADMINNEFINFFLPLVLTMPIMIFATCFGMAATNALSHEGRDVMVSKYIPIDYRDQYKAKIISALIINMISVLIAIGVFILFGFPIKTIILGSILAFLTVVFVTFSGVYMDYANPNLHWTDEKKCGDGGMKNIIHVILLLLVGFIVGGISYSVGGSGFKDNMNTAGLIVFLINVLAMVPATYIIYRINLGMAPETYKKHEI